MDAVELYRFMNDPTLLSNETLPVLKQIVDEYPYFHTARTLYLKNLALLDDMCLEAELKKMAINIPDRKKLFMLLEGEHYRLQIMQSTAKKALDQEDSFSLIDAFLFSDVNKDRQDAESSILFQPSASSDYIYWSLSKEEEKQDVAEPEVRLQHQNLIDSFIESEEQRASVRGLNIEPSEEISTFPTQIDETEDTHLKSLEDSYFTETLAHIYVKQKRYEKALQIIKNLNLKYPEKNVYFADQIRFLEKLIINTKK
ncbi:MULTISPECIES: hypothetical protein [Bacteroidales]|uniref:hypothetical protein n=2 Tax=Parabacteroides bouchesdurhonensis TaxID=1936995 RepID=UPI000E4F93AD|nr:hypothetical protein DW095_02580 [Bacteroides sp. AM07-16]